MKKILLSAMLFAIILQGCTKPNAIVYDNPNDPSNQVFSNPTVTITQGPAEGSTATNSTVTFSWRGEGSAVEYSYMMDGDLWSSWSTQTACSLSYVYEGLRTFNVKARNEKQQEGPVSTRNFTVNNVNGPALMIFPRAETVDVGSYIYIYCKLEEIVKPVMGAHLIMTYDTTRLTYLYADVVGCLWNENGGTIIGPYDYSSSNIIDWSVSIAGGTPAGINPEHGAILRIYLRGKATGFATVSFNATSALRDTLNNPIASFTRYGCTITVK